MTVSLHHVGRARFSSILFTTVRWQMATLGELARRNSAARVNILGAHVCFPSNWKGCFTGPSSCSSPLVSPTPQRCGRARVSAFPRLLCGRMSVETGVYGHPLRSCLLGPMATAVRQGGFPTTTYAGFPPQHTLTGKNAPPKKKQKKTEWPWFPRKPLQSHPMILRFPETGFAFSKLLKGGIYLKVSTGGSLFS